MKNIEWLVKRNNNCNEFQIISLLLVLLAVFRVENTLACNDLSLVDSDNCLCYTLEEAVFLDCQDTSVQNIKNAFQSVSNIHSFTVYDLDGNEEVLGPSLIPNNVCIKHFHMSRTSITNIEDETFAPLRKCLETLSIVSSKLKLLPQKAISGLSKLLSLEITSNYIQELPNYSFYGLSITKLVMKGNIIEYVPIHAFSGLEQSLTELDLSENNITIFPMAAIVKLNHLQYLRLAWNEISAVQSVENAELFRLEYLDLNSNNFEFISEDCLKFSPSLTTLSFHFNFVTNIHYKAFVLLKNLKSIDLSYNRIKILSSQLFQHNKNLEFIDLSHNHLHHINGLLCSMPSLTKILLGHNNILEVPMDSFINSTKINILHLDKNCISNINSESFSDLVNLEELRLDFNYISQVPHTTLILNEKLITLRIDNNKIHDINNDTFKSLKYLKEIRIHNNELSSIPKSLFLNSTKVETIYLNHNKITFIESGAFALMTNLKLIYLNNNKLIDIKDTLPKGGTNLLTIFLHSNMLTSINNYELQNRLFHLNLNQNRVKFLTKFTFGNLTYLTRLEISNNDISEIYEFSFQRLSSARYLDLQRNSIRNITTYTFFGLAELEVLDISFNKINYIFEMAFENLKKLRSLNLSFNPLKILFQNTFQFGLPLSTLYLDSCEIQVIENGTFHGLNNLKMLTLRNNSLKAKDLLVFDIPGLKMLSLSDNILDYLPVDAFYQLPLLEILVLEHCNIQEIVEGTFTANSNLIKLQIAQNILSTIPNTIFGPLNSIAELNISNNFLDYVPYDTFYNVTSVETLDLSDNLLPKVELSGFQELRKLKYLILRKNEIKSILCKKKITLIELLLFDVSYNRLDHLPATIFEYFPKIQNINISNNNIIHFDFLFAYKKFGFPLINIDLSKNSILTLKTPKGINKNSLIANIYELYITTTNLSNVEEIPFELFISLQHLYLRHNKIRRLSISPFSKLTYLENLDLSYNRITHLKSSNFRGLVKLSALCLSHNNIESMDSFDEDLSNLKLLDLSHNKLQNILNEDLINLKELTVLDLSHNNIKYISVTAFKYTNKIVQLDLDNNKLQNIPLDLLNSIENHIQEISIKENVIICLCQKNNTWTWIQDHPKVIKQNTVSCLNDQYPKVKCDFPSITQVSVDKHKDNSVSLSWFIRNRTAIKVLQIIYYNDVITSEVITKYVDYSETSTYLTNLKPNTNYVVCILASNGSPVISDENGSILNINSTVMDQDVMLKINRSLATAAITQSTSSECISFDTFTKPLTVKMKNKKALKISSILNRRLGLIVGCSLGCVVFVIMVSVLLYTKIKERKRIAKSDPAWSEMNDYHSVHSKEDILQSSTTASTDNILLGMAKNRNISLEKMK
ncbi:protein artichoke-like [Leptidea sinapis]|uniref:protein artichoke-like n=1 Tax=Leptidea sinapis TaxID=189913 RepID=UPI002136ECD0|nr:protein artichoke-like [Leptidea sinapis]